MTPLINFTNPITILVATVLYVLILLLAKETKKSAVIATMLVVFLAIIIGHSVEFVNLKPGTADIGLVSNCITMDLVFIGLSYFSYLWIDDIQAKAEKKKSIDDSLSWLWTKV